MTAAAPMPEFALSDPLPEQTMVLEASAGTGKTYAIVSLAVRYLAAGVPVSRLLMATFSNAASAELRDRTRGRLVECLAALADPDSARSSDDELIAMLAGDREAGLIRRRLADALADFDAATLATTHTFCNRMLAVLGFLGDREQHLPIVADVDELVAELATDMYLAEFAGDPGGVLGPADVTTIAEQAVRNPSAELAPSGLDAPPDEVVLRLRLAAAARTATAARKRAARVRTYDDLQTTLHRIVTDPQVGEQARSRIAAQFDVVLIDEFQDTDPQQWAIVEHCFHGRLPLILVGDPKQSIYAFRGAEVLSYLAAVQAAAQRRRLSVNRRSDEAVVSALGTLFAQATFGHPEIAFTPVRAHRPGSGLHGAAPVRLRTFLADDECFTVYSKDGSVPLVPGVRDAVIDDVAADIAALLASDTELDDPDTGGRRSVHPGDVAVLLRTNKTVEPLQRALAAHGISSVVRAGTSIFATAAARHWWYVLQAVEAPSRQNRVRLAALTPLLGESASSLDEAGDAGVGRIAARLAELGRVFAEGGFAPMAARLMDLFGTTARVLAMRGGERLLTDLLQVSDLCNRQLPDTGGGLSALVAWLGEQIGDTSAWRGGDEATRRLDRDTQAVQIMTVHASKGLEFPIVYVPFGWDGGARSLPEAFVYHDEHAQRRLDVGGREAPGRRGREAAARRENAGEDLRLLYVAATRARSQVVLWWAPSTTTADGALHRLLFTQQQRLADGRPGPIPEVVALPGSSHEVVAGLRAVAASGAGIVVEPAGRHGAVPQWRPPQGATAVPELDVAEFTRPVDQQWRRTSYSAMVAAAHARAHAGADLVTTGSEAEAQLRGDEPVDGGPTDEDTAAGALPAGALASPMNGLPFGAAFGTLVHDVLEHVDTAAADLPAHVHEMVLDSAARTGLDADVRVLAEALVAVLTTPIGLDRLGGGGAGDLVSIPPGDRLAELDFELPLAQPGFTLAQVGALLEAMLPADDPLAAYAQAVRTVSEETFRGFLTGSIDSVLRVAAEPADPADTVGRFTVVDYKTNRLRPGELAVTDFSRPAMAAEMITAHYPLQALLYSVALHRYLRWRLPGYRPERHLGPVQYHFVRGMAGPQTPPGCGVFEWHPPAQLVIALSELLAGRGGAS